MSGEEDNTIKNTMNKKNIPTPLKIFPGYRINQPANTARQKFQYGFLCGLFLTPISTHSSLRL